MVLFLIIKKTKSLWQLISGTGGRTIVTRFCLSCKNIISAHMQAAINCFTHCFLVAGRNPTISIACWSRSKSCRRSSSSSILKFCCKFDPQVSRRIKLIGKKQGQIGTKTGGAGMNGRGWGVVVGVGKGCNGWQTKESSLTCSTTRAQEAARIYRSCTVLTANELQHY